MMAIALSFYSVAATWLVVMQFHDSEYHRPTDFKNIALLVVGGIVFTGLHFLMKHLARKG